MLRSFFFFALLTVVSALAKASSFEILKEKPFNHQIFTQGFVKSQGHFFVSSGGYGRSFIGELNEQGKLIKMRALSDKLFAEGLTEKGGILYVLSWKAGILSQFSASDLKPLKTQKYSGEGWGLTHDNLHLILSNGSNLIQFKNIEDLKTVKTLNVTDDGKPLNRINELEYALGSLWANVWHDDHIYRISPDTGKVIAKWNLSSLRKQLKRKHPEAVLNGIAYDEAEQAFWVTGKMWPKRYLVKFDSMYSSDTEAQSQ